MDWSALAIVIATFGGPIAAVQIQKYRERRQEQQRLKDWTFRTLMSTRAPGNRTSLEHVQALNGIELTFSSSKLTFSSKKDEAVVEAWNAYRDLLHTSTTQNEAQNERLFEKRGDAFWDLLHVMSKSLGYPFDRTHIKNGGYTPIAHGDLWQDQEIIRRGFAGLFSGKVALPIIAYMPEQAPRASVEAGTPPTPAAEN